MLWDEVNHWFIRGKALTVCKHLYYMGIRSFDCFLSVIVAYQLSLFKPIFIVAKFIYYSILQSLLVFNLTRSIELNLNHLFYRWANQKHGTMYKYFFVYHVQIFNSCPYLRSMSIYENSRIELIIIGGPTEQKIRRSRTFFRAQPWNSASDLGQDRPDWTKTDRLLS